MMHPKYKHLPMIIFTNVPANRCVNKYCLLPTIFVDTPEGAFIKDFLKAIYNGEKQFDDIIPYPISEIKRIRGDSV